MHGSRAGRAARGPGFRGSSASARAESQDLAARERARRRRRRPAGRLPRSRSRPAPPGPGQLGSASSPARPITERLPSALRQQSVRRAPRPTRPNSDPARARGPRELLGDRAHRQRSDRRNRSAVPSAAIMETLAGFCPRETDPQRGGAGAVRGSTPAQENGRHAWPCRGIRHRADPCQRVQGGVEQRRVQAEAAGARPLPPRAGRPRRTPHPPRAPAPHEPWKAGRTRSPLAPARSYRPSTVDRLRARRRPGPKTARSPSRRGRVRVRRQDALAWRVQSLPAMPGLAVLETGVDRRAAARPARPAAPSDDLQLRRRPPRAAPAEPASVELVARHRSRPGAARAAPARRRPCRAAARCRHRVVGKPGVGRAARAAR